MTEGRAHAQWNQQTTEALADLRELLTSVDMEAELPDSWRLQCEAPQSTDKDTPADAQQPHVKKLDSAMQISTFGLAGCTVSHSRTEIGLLPSFRWVQAGTMMVAVGVPEATQEAVKAMQELMQSGDQQKILQACESGALQVGTVGPGDLLYVPPGAVVSHKTNSSDVLGLRFGVLAYEMRERLQSLQDAFAQQAALVGVLTAASQRVSSFEVVLSRPQESAAALMIEAGLESAGERKDQDQEGNGSGSGSGAKPAAAEAAEAEMPLTQAEKQPLDPAKIETSAAALPKQQEETNEVDAAEAGEAEQAPAKKDATLVVGEEALPKQQEETNEVDAAAAAEAEQAPAKTDSTLVGEETAATPQEQSAALKAAVDPPVEGEKTEAAAPAGTAKPADPAKEKQKPEEETTKADLSKGRKKTEEEQEKKADTPNDQKESEKEKSESKSDQEKKKQAEEAAARAANLSQQEKKPAKTAEKAAGAAAAKTGPKKREAEKKDKEKDKDKKKTKR